MTSDTSGGDDGERAFADALARFETALRDILQGEAQRSIHAALQRLPSGPFDVRDVDFDVVIRNVTLESRSNGSAPKPKSKSKAKPKPRRKRPDAPRPRGRPHGVVRSTILSSFDSDEELSTTDLRNRLTSAGVKTSSDNLHQQLRRLTTAGDLVRAGRGVYRRG